MTDLDRYLTDEMIEQGRKALTFGIMGCGCCGENPPDELDHLDFDVARAHVAARATLEAAAPLIAAQALRDARDAASGELLGLLHAENDAQYIGGSSQGMGPVEACETAEGWLDARADRIEQGGQP